MVKLSDFGLSGFIADHDGENGYIQKICGTPNYTAPEIFQQQEYEGPPVDVWSLSTGSPSMVRAVQQMLDGIGVVLYVMVVWKLPFLERSVSRLVGKIVSRTYELPESLSPAFQDLLQKMLKPNPGKRIRLVDIVKHPWTTSDANTDAVCKKNEEFMALDSSSVRKKSCSSNSDRHSLMKHIKLNVSHQESRASDGDTDAVVSAHRQTCSAECEIVRPAFRRCKLFDTKGQ